ncbi:MAG: flippase-like domain-containing protein [Bacteroidetes bacterium]|nr:flippase-like domain-containing protein [Bacteroidota bacterium]
MKKKLFSIARNLFFLGIGIFLVWWQLGKMSDSQEEQFKESLLHARYIYIIPVIIMALLSHLSRALRWRILMEPMGYRPKASNTFYATLCGYFANNFVPRAGEVLRCTLLSKYENIPVTKLIGTVLLERVFDFVTYLFIILITVLIQVKTVSNFVQEKFSHFSGGNKISWPKYLAILLVLFCFLFVLKGLFKKYLHMPFVQKLTGYWAGLKEGFSSIMHLKKRKLFLAHTCFIWAMYLLQIFVGFQALTQTAHLGIGAAFSVLSLSTLAMIVAPGGIGAFPVAVQQVLLIYNIENISFGWLMWSVSTGIILIAGLISFGLIIYQNKINNEENPNHPRQDIAEGNIAS